jgi:hypothetical protein
MTERLIAHIAAHSLPALSNAMTIDRRNVRDMNQTMRMDIISIEERRRESLEIKVEPPLCCDYSAADLGCAAHLQLPSVFI